MYLNPRVLDYGLFCLVNETTALWLTDVPPVDYADTLIVGTRPFPLVVGPQNAEPTGRMVTVQGIDDGDVVLNGTARHWALVDDRGDGRLLAAGDLTAPLAVESHNSFTLDAFNIVLPGLAP